MDQNDKLAKFSFSVRKETAKALLMDPFGLTKICWRCHDKSPQDNWLMAAPPRSSDLNFWESADWQILASPEQQVDTEMAVPRPISEVVFFCFSEVFFFVLKNPLRCRLLRTWGSASGCVLPLSPPPHPLFSFPLSSFLLVPSSTKKF